MHHEHRRVGTGGMREAKLGDVSTNDRWRVRLVRHLDRAGHLRSAEFMRGRCVRAMDRRKQFAQPGPVFRADPHGLGPFHEGQLARQQRLGLLLLVVGLAIPLVDGHHQRTPGIQGQGQHGRVLIGHALARIQHDHRHLALLDRLQGLDDRELLDHLVNLALATHACGVDQSIKPTVALHVDGDRVARGPRNLRGDHPFLAEQAVDQR